MFNDEIVLFTKMCYANMVLRTFFGAIISNASVGTELLVGAPDSKFNQIVRKNYASR